METIEIIILNIVTGLCSAGLYGIFLIQKEKIRYKKYYNNLSGYWVEIIRGQENRKYSIGSLSYNSKLKRAHYNGINFNNDGSVHYYWRTEKTWVDPDKDKMLYIYSVSKNGKKYEIKEGFGVNMIERVNNQANFTSGYFLDSDVITKPREVEFYRLEDFAIKHNYAFKDMSERSWSKFIKERLG